jgi:hemerythrin-like domain-containing protein
MEHQEIEQSLERLPGVEELDHARELLLHVVATAREHFAKEEKILFPLASQMLSHDELSSLGDQWAARRAIVLE